MGFDFFDKELFGEDTDDTIETGTAVDTGYRLGRKIYTPKEGGRYWLYFATGKLLGNDAEVNFTTSHKDPVAYSQISFIFEVLGEKTIPIYLEELSFKNSDGKTVNTTNYFVRFTEDDELGGDFTVSIKPKNESDKNFWKHFMERFQKKRELEAKRAAKATEGGDVTPETTPDKPEKNKKA